MHELAPNCGVGRPIQLNPPLDEAHVREAEARSGITLPDDYRLFLSKIGNGGQIGVIRYMTLDEVLAANSASVWSEPLQAGQIIRRVEELSGLVGLDNGDERLTGHRDW